MALNTTFYIFTLILIFLCGLEIMTKEVVDDRIKILLLIVVILSYLNSKKENFSIFKSLDSNEVVDTGRIFYENPSRHDNLKKLGPLKDLPRYDDSTLHLFSENECKPECCPSQYSCDRGCICMTPEQKMRLYQHK